MYAYTAKEVFAAREAEILRGIDRPMTALEFYRLVAPLVSALKSGHTYVALPGWSEHLRTDGRFHPFDVRWHGQDVILAHAYGSSSPPLGGTVLTFNGRPATELLLQLSCYFSAEGLESNRFELERPAVLQQVLWSEFQTADLRLRIRDLQGHIHESVIRPVTLQNAVKEKMPHHDEGLFSLRHLAELRAALLRIESFSLEHQSEFQHFLAKAFGDLQAQQADSLLLDLRDNAGGASLGVHTLLAYLTEREIALQEGESSLFQALSRQRHPSVQPFRGRVFVLIGKRTSSAAMGCAAAIRYYRLGTLVGEETADRMQFFGESRRFTLPHSGLTYVVASDRTVVVGGKGQSGGLKPDYEVKQEPQDTARGADTVVGFTLKLIRNQQGGVDVGSSGSDRARGPRPANGTAALQNRPEIGWDEALEGVQARLYAKQTDWNEGTIPRLFVDVRNQGRRHLRVHTRQMRGCEIEADGRWFRRPIRTRDTRALPSPFPPGRQYDGIVIKLDGYWEPEGEAAKRSAGMERHKTLSRRTRHSCGGYRHRRQNRAGETCPHNQQPS